MNVRFEFHKKSSPADGTTVEFDAGVVEHGAGIGRRQDVVLVPGGLMRYDELTVSISDPDGSVPNLRAEFPLAGAGDAV